MFNLQELLRRAAEKGIDDRRIAEITGRNYATIWRWRNKPPSAFVCDEGVMRLVREIEAGSLSGSAPSVRPPNS